MVKKDINPILRRCRRCKGWFWPGNVEHRKGMNLCLMCREEGERMDEEKKIKPKPNCKWCYGRGYIGIDHKTRVQIPCPCITKQEMKRQKEEIKQNRLRIKVDQPVVGAKTNIEKVKES